MLYHLIIAAPATNGSVNETLLARFEARDDAAAVAHLNDPNNTRLFCSGGTNWRNWCVLRRAGEWSGSQDIPFRKKEDLR